MQNPEKLQGPIESKFNIAILTGQQLDRFWAEAAWMTRAEIIKLRAELKAGAGRPIPQNMKYRVFLTDWDSSSLKTLGSTLDILPPHFYVPQKNAYRLRFGLCYSVPSGLDTSHLNGFVVCLNKTRLRPRIFNKKTARREIVHELTHYAIIPSYFGLLEKLAEKVGIKDQSTLREPFLPIIEEYDYDSSHDGSLRRWKEYIGYGATNFKEFLGVAAELYTDGSNSFLKAYSRFLGLQKAQGLYGIMRDDVFQGREYPSKH